MGTNYYAKKHTDHAISCPGCGAQIIIPGATEEFHIGKSSWGWKFLFATEKFDSWETFKQFIEKDVINGDWWIENEDGEKEDPLDFVMMIGYKQQNRDNERCEKRGSYNFLEGEFS